MQPNLLEGLAVSFSTLVLVLNGLNLASFGHGLVTTLPIPCPRLWIPGIKLIWFQLACVVNAMKLSSVIAQDTSSVINVYQPTTLEPLT